MTVEALFHDTCRYLMNEYNMSSAFLFALGTVFLSLNLILCIIDANGWCLKWRIIPDKYPDKDLILKSISNLMLNQFGLIFPLTYFGYYSIRTMGGGDFLAPIPSFSTIVVQILISMTLSDTVFYWMHRFMHLPFIYGYVHKQHHNFRYSIGMASEYAHPLETILCNHLPFSLGPTLLGMHPFTVWIWLVIVITETTDSHSGYVFPFSPFHLLPIQGGSAKHYFHHFSPMGCYGSFWAFWDKLCGTDTAFYRWKAVNEKSRIVALQKMAYHHNVIMASSDKKQHIISAKGHFAA